MLRSEEIADLAAALSKAQAEMRAAALDRENTYHRSRYASLDSVWSACREPLTKHALAVVQTMEPTEDPALLTVVTTLLHSSGQWISSRLTMPVVKPEKRDGSGPPGRIDPQAVGSCITYARRYGLAAMVGVAPDEDDDGEAASQKAPQAQQAPRQGRPAAERAVQGAERQASYAAATGAAKSSPKAAETPEPESSGDEAAACQAARGAFFANFKEHFGDVEREERHAILNQLLQPKAPITTQEGWSARHFIRALDALTAHFEDCEGGSACALLHTGSESATEPVEAPTPNTQRPTPNGAAPTGAARCSVESCGKPLTRGQIDVSKRAFGRSLCPSCQKEAKAEAAG